MTYELVYCWWRLWSSKFASLSCSPPPSRSPRMSQPGLLFPLFVPKWVCLGFTPALGESHCLFLLLFPIRASTHPSISIISHLTRVMNMEHVWLNSDLLQLMWTSAQTQPHAFMEFLVVTGEELRSRCFAVNIARILNMSLCLASSFSWFCWARATRFRTRNNSSWKSRCLFLSSFDPSLKIDDESMENQCLGFSAVFWDAGLLTKIEDARAWRGKPTTWRLMAVAFFEKVDCVSASNFNSAALKTCFRISCSRARTYKSRRSANKQRYPFKNSTSACSRWAFSFAMRLSANNCRDASVSSMWLFMWDKCTRENLWLEVSEFRLDRLVPSGSSTAIICPSTSEIITKVITLTIILFVIAIWP